MIGQFAAVGIGAALGAWLRWGLSACLNPKAPSFPLGTLAANLIGGYLVGLAQRRVFERYADRVHSIALHYLRGDEAAAKDRSPRRCS